MKFQMMIGVPGSGKSTYAKKNLSGVYLSSDDLRDELGKIDIWDEMHQRARDALAAGEDVIYDATSVKRKDRCQILAEAKALGAETIAFVMETPMDECLRRNKERRKERIVPEKVIEQMAENYDPPKEGEFDKIVLVNRDEETPLSIEGEGVRADWYRAGEGYWGDYNPENPEDVELLRFDVYWEQDGRWEEVEDASYCTCTAVNDKESELLRKLKTIHREYVEALRTGGSVKKLGEALSWI